MKIIGVSLSKDHFHNLLLCVPWALQFFLNPFPFNLHSLARWQNSKNNMNAGFLLSLRSRNGYVSFSHRKKKSDKDYWVISLLVKNLIKFIVT